MLSRKYFKVYYAANPSLKAAEQTIAWLCERSFVRKLWLLLQTILRGYQSIVCHPGFEHRLLPRIFWFIAWDNSFSLRLLIALKSHVKSEPTWVIVMISVHVELRSAKPFICEKVIKNEWNTLRRCFFCPLQDKFYSFFVRLLQVVFCAEVRKVIKNHTSLIQKNAMQYDPRSVHYCSAKYLNEIDMDMKRSLSFNSLCQRVKLNAFLHVTVAPQ